MSQNFPLQHQLGNNDSGWHEKRVESLLDDASTFSEVPRATSAPPHLEEQTWRAGLAATGPRPGYNFDGRITPVAPDIRFDPDYADFYRQEMANGQVLPAPIPESSLFPDIERQRRQNLAGHQFPNGAGLEPINEQRVSPDLSAMFGLAQLALDRGASPSPLQQHAAQQPRAPSAHQQMVDNFIAQNSGDQTDMMQQIALQRIASNTPPPLPHTPPIPPSTPPVLSGTPNLAANIANTNVVAAALAMQNMQASMPPPHMNGNGVDMMANNIFYQAALSQQHAAARNMGMGMGMMPPHLQPMHSHFPGPMLGGHPGMMGMPPMGMPFYGANPNYAAQIAAAAVSLQNMMINQNRDMHDDKRGRDRRGGRRDRREVDRERERERHDLDGLNDGSTFRFTTLEEVQGTVLQTAKDQNGCRFLQKKFDEGGAAAISMVFNEILDNLIELMMDPFGNYLIQKLLDRCSEEQRLQVITKAAEKGELVNVALNTHGTRAVQKLIETLTNPEQINLVVESLSVGVVMLIRDLNGNHVIQRCLQRLGPERSQFVYDAACANTMDIATHRHGCCVLQRCIDFSTPTQKRELVDEIAKNALVLSQDPFGNYVVQYVLELGAAEATGKIMMGLFSHYPDLAQQKFSSNVVEKCLKLGGPGLAELREKVILELLGSPMLPRLLQDPYANYVLQSALAVSNGQLHAQLVDAIKPYLPSLRGTPHGKRILSKINVKI